MPKPIPPCPSPSTHQLYICLNGRIDLVDPETGSTRTIEEGQAVGGVFLPKKSKLALVMERQTMLRMAWMERHQGGGGGGGSGGGGSGGGGNAEKESGKKPRTPKSREGRFRVSFGANKNKEAEEEEEKERAEAAAKEAARKAPIANVAIPDFTVEADVFRNAAKDFPTKQIALFHPGTDYLTLNSADVMPMLDSITDKVPFLVVCATPPHPTHRPTALTAPPHSPLSRSPSWPCSRPSDCDA